MVHYVLVLDDGEALGAHELHASDTVNAALIDRGGEKPLVRVVGRVAADGRSTSSRCSSSSRCPRRVWRNSRRR
jgi:hypothetical protein